MIVTVVGTHGIWLFSLILNHTFTQISLFYSFTCYIGYYLYQRHLLSGCNLICGWYNSVNIRFCDKRYGLQSKFNHETCNSIENKRLVLNLNKTNFRIYYFIIFDGSPCIFIGYLLYSNFIGKYQRQTYL